MLEQNDLKNLAVLLQTGRWNHTVQESQVVLDVLNKVANLITKEEKKEEVVKDN